jgi:hypothetical protein
MIPIPFASAIGSSSVHSRVVQAVVIMDQAGIDVERRENSHPEIYRINSEADATYTPFPFQLQHRLIAFGESPLGVLTSLVFDIVDVNQIEIVSPQAFSTLVNRLANPSP